MSQGCYPGCFYYTDSCFRKDCKISLKAIAERAQAEAAQHDEQAQQLFPELNELWDADPKCQHDIQLAPGGGVKCTKCSGWFCF